MTIASAPKALCAVDARVVRVAAICREHVYIEATLPNLPPSHPGQFVQVLCRDESHNADSEHMWPADGFPSLNDVATHAEQAYLRRPFSLADRWEDRDGHSHFALISRAVGTGTRWLERLQAGATLNVTGPLGRGFRLPTAEQELVLVGGGVGIPPLLYLARTLHSAGAARVTVILGAMSGDLLPVRLDAQPRDDALPTACVTYPGGARYPTCVTTDDGSCGLRGRVTDALAAWNQQRTPGTSARVFACGPDGMLRAIAAQTRALGVACELCIERNMGCGVGTCLSCVVRVRDESRPAGWRWALTCTDGPVFARDELLDERPAASA